MNIHARFKVGHQGFGLDVDLDLPGQGVTALFGPSGSGKTTVLRCLAGLERASLGYLEVNGEVWQDAASAVFLPTHQRSVGYVFQEASLFSHLSVRRNLEYGLKRTPGAERRVVWDQALDLLGIGHLLERTSDRLSGGERQRVAIARALLTSPKLLLMDEPLAALDLKRKLEILPYLERLQKELAIPVIYVSHQPDEVLRLADHLVLLNEGRVVASGPLADNLARLDLPIVEADDAGVVIETEVAEQDEKYHLTRLDFPGGSVFVSHHLLELGQRVRLQVNARDVSLAIAPEEGSSIVNGVAAIVEELGETDNRAKVLVRLNACGTSLLARITRRSLDQLGLKVGSPVWAQIKNIALRT